MHLLIQRVKHAAVHIDSNLESEIGPGLLVFVCAEATDTETTVERAVAKLLKLRIFSDDAGKMNRSVQDVGGALLIVSQFTLAADLRQGNRPSFIGAAPPAQGLALYEKMLAVARAAHPKVSAGRFGADMQVSLVNDGPVTIPFRLG